MHINLLFTSVFYALRFTYVLLTNQQDCKKVIGVKEY